LKAGTYGISMKMRNRNENLRYENSNWYLACDADEIPIYDAVPILKLEYRPEKRKKDEFYFSIYRWTRDVVKYLMTETAF
jgi:hypothetical protein